jgi:2'-hydroxyisoflavone reductase
VTRSLLVLGGSSFVGRALVAEGLEGGWAVTTFNRGVTGGGPDSSARAVIGDRLRPETLERLTDRDWDLVVDTWSGAPRAVRDSAGALRDRADRYAYISSESVYVAPPPPGATESTSTVAASPNADDGDYAERKRGAEIALEQAFPDRSLFARAGLILGPHENVGRLTWWLSRMARGGEVLCPGPEDMPIQYVDARDLARFVIAAAASGQTGAFNVVCRRGHATIGTLLDACLGAAGAPDAVMTWVDPDAILAAGIEPWEELPVWIPPGHEFAALHDSSVERAHHAGLQCRPVDDTVRDTWEWFRTLDITVPVRPDLPPLGIEPERERAVLRDWHVARGSA